MRQVKKVGLALIGDINISEKAHYKESVLQLFKDRFRAQSLDFDVKLEIFDPDTISRSGVSLKLEDDKTLVSRNNGVSYNYTKRAFLAFSVARTSEFNFLFLHLGMEKYNPKVLVEFMFDGLKEMLSRRFVLGEPPLFNGDAKKFKKEFSDTERMAYLTLNTFGNLILSHYIPKQGSPSFHNFDTSLLGVKIDKDLLVEVMKIKHFEDNSLVVPQILWPLLVCGEGYSTSTVALSDISMDEFTFDPGQSTRDLACIITMIEMKNSGQEVAIRTMLGDFFTVNRSCTNLIDRKSDELRMFLKSALDCAFNMVPEIMTSFRHQ